MRRLVAVGVLTVFTVSGSGVGARAQRCDPSYRGVCIPPPPPDLDCSEISERNFEVVGDDPHHFDRDRDGIGCEEE